MIEALARIGELAEIRLVTIEISPGEKLLFGLARYANDRWASQLLADDRVRHG